MDLFGNPMKLTKTQSGRLSFHIATGILPVHQIRDVRDHISLGLSITRAVNAELTQYPPLHHIS